MHNQQHSYEIVIEINAEENDWKEMLNWLKLGNIFGNQNKKKEKWNKWKLRVHKVVYIIVQLPSDLIPMLVHQLSAILYAFGIGTFTTI